MSASPEAPPDPPEAPGRAPVASVDDVRVELRRLGYLDHGVDRFILGDAARQGAWRASWRAARRVGWAGGALATLALLVLTVAVERRWPSEPRDLAFLALYLFVVLGAALALLALLAGLAAAWSWRHLKRAPAPRVPRDLGLLAGVATLVYLALWWRSHAGAAGAGGQALALVLALALAAALGRFVSLAAVAVLSAAGAAASLPRASLSRRRMLPLLAATAVLLLALVALGSYRAGRLPPVPDFAVVPTGLRVRLVAIDGLEARMTAQMLERGAMPRLQALLDGSAHGRLQAEPEAVPAIVWTTIATGRGPQAHGIRAAGARRLAGMRTPVSQPEGRLLAALGTATDLLRLTRSQPPTALLRSVKTFWNVASEKGLRVGIVNWWATWPADALNGYVVSDRTVFKLERGGDAEREVYPPEAFEGLRGLALFEAPSGSQAGDDLDARARGLDAFHVAAALRLRAQAAAPDLEALYLPGLDIVTVQRLGDVAAADLATLDRRLEAVRAYYAYVDTLLGRLTADLAPAEMLVLVGDPGRLARASARPAEGVFVLRGAACAAGDLGPVGSRDVAPTLLHLLGLPVSRELEGRVLEAALSAQFRTAHPARQVEAYGRRPAAAATESAFDREMLEELRSLGYVQ